MAKKTKEELKKYFETGDKPSQTEYAELIDAFRHSDDKLPIADVDSLQDSLDSKASSSVLLNHINDTSLHQSNMSGADIKIAYEAEADTNAFTDTEKQQVADGVAHRADSSSHVSASDKVKWNNSISDWQSNETFTDEMGSVIRIGANNRMYKLVATRPFTTQNIITEAEENPKKWQILGASFPSAAVSTLSKTSIPPNTTFDLYVTGAFFTPDTTLTVDTFTTNNIHFPPEGNFQTMVVNLTSPATYNSDLNITVDNGQPIVLTEKFTVSDGTVYIPDTIGDSLFQLTQGDANDLVLSQGKVRNLNGSSSSNEGVKIMRELTGDWKIEWDVTTNNNGETYEGDIGITPVSDTATGRHTCRYMFYHQLSRYYMYNYSTKIGESIATPTNHSIEKVGTDVIFSTDGVPRATLNNQSDDTFIMYIFSNSLTTHENIKLTQY